MSTRATLGAGVKQLNHDALLKNKKVIKREQQSENGIIQGLGVKECAQSRQIYDTGVPEHKEN